jgi:hypothetical protein
MRAIIDLIKNHRIVFYVVTCGLKNSPMTVLNCHASCASAVAEARDRGGYIIPAFRVRP